MKKSIPFAILLKSLGITKNKIYNILKNKNFQLNSVENEELNAKKSLNELNKILTEQGINIVRILKFKNQN